MAHRHTPAPTHPAASLNEAGAVLPAVLREADAARYIGLSQAYLRKSRLFGRGPAFVRLRRTVMYRVRDLDQFLESHLVNVA